MRLNGFLLFLISLTAGCVSSGPVMDQDPQALPVEQIAEPSDGIANEV